MSLIEFTTGFCPNTSLSFILSLFVSRSLCCCFCQGNWIILEISLSSFALSGYLDLMLFSLPVNSLSKHHTGPELLLAPCGSGASSVFRIWEETQTQHKDTKTRIWTRLRGNTSTLSHRPPPEPKYQTAKASHLIILLLFSPFYYVE